MQSGWYYKETFLSLKIRDFLKIHLMLQKKIDSESRYRKKFFFLFVRFAASLLLSAQQKSEKVVYVDNNGKH